MKVAATLRDRQAPAHWPDVFRTEEVTPKLIEAIKARIVESLRPEKIILYGSRARGQETACSDLDLLVVMETGKPRSQRAADVSRLIYPRLFPMDVIVYTPEEFETAARHEDYYFDPFLKEVLEDGVILYERPSA